ncbi:MAG TPA: VWA domain-containing protein [Candidatus Acidoferrum sp.]|nr:VWA domain-containing protein [Candidatus Acidoferrum sp.]
MRRRLRAAARFSSQVLALTTLVLVPTLFSTTHLASAQQSNATQTRGAGDQATLKTTVRQVLLDVVVTDGKNRPVTGLQKDHFFIAEDGQAQQILYFEAHTVSADAATPKPSEMPALPANTFRNTSPVPGDLPLNVLLYDLVNTPIDDQPFAHKQIVKFLNNRPVGSRFAIFVLADTLHLLQGFTDDERQLVGAMNRKETGPQSSSFYQTKDSHIATDQLAGSALFANDPAAQAMVDRMKPMEAFTRNYFLNRRVELTIGAFEEIANFLGGLPGRKNLIWLSGAFPINIFPSGNDPLDPFGATVNYRSDLSKVADLLTVGQVAVYPVDIRGLTTDPVFDASNAAHYSSGSALSQAHLHFMTRIALEQATMDEIADDTGGHAFYNTNGLAGAITASTEDGSNYYTLGYSPSNTKFDGRLRRIRIQLGQGSHHLAYRHSYLADESVTAGKADKAPFERLQAALRRGVPLAQELAFEARITPQGRARAVTKEEISQLAPFPAFVGRKKWDGTRIQVYLIDYAIRGSQISFETSADGTNHAKFEFLFGAYDAENRTMFGDRSPVEKTYSLDKIDDTQRGAYHVQQLLEVPSGAAWLRLAVRDVIGNHLGSIEIPLPLGDGSARRSANAH